MNIVVLDSYTANPGDLDWEALFSLGEVVLYDRTSPEETIARALEADAILTNKVVLNSDTLARLPRLKYIGVLATGTNVVDLECAKRLNITTTNVPQYSTESVVQHTFAHLLNLASRIAENAAATRNGEWSTCKDFSFTKGKLTELYGKQLGVVGYGAIGRRVAQTAEVFGMNVVAFSPRLEIGTRREFATAVSLDDLFSTSDVVSLHCPLTSTTRRLVDAKRIATMRDGALLVNTGRGALIDEKAVADALISGKLGGAGLDVLSSEPPEPTNPLLTAPNCWVTPHNAWASPEARRRLLDVAIANLRAFQEGRPQNVVE